jgi:hypothetical protein
MVHEDANGEHRWYYDSPRTLAGQLQRGLGRGAFDAERDAAAADLVMACIRRDYRWYWIFDDRAVYLARLVRDLALPIEPIIAVLDSAPLVDDHDNALDNASGVLDVLARAGIEQARGGLRRYVSDGDGWVKVIELMAATWEARWWDDLLPVALDRLRDDDVGRLLWRSRPWSDWAQRDERISALVRAAAEARSAPPRRFAQHSTAVLLATLQGSGPIADRREALQELNRREPEPSILTMIDDLPIAEFGGRLGIAVQRLGEVALPVARQWAAANGHPLVWTAYRVLAEHGDENDLSAVFAGLDWLDARRDDWCGYDVLANGLARIGGPSVGPAVPRLRRLWNSPHSFERPDYLRSLVALDPRGGVRCLVEGLWDCESGVRLLAAQKAPVDDFTTPRLRYLRDDPMESAEVRAAAAERLA